MGICASSNGPSAADIQEAKRTKDLSDAIQKKLTEDLQLHKLLLLGAGESGKSTLFKQLVNLYSPDKNPDPAELKRHTVIIHENIITNAKTLEEASYQHGEPTSEEAIAASCGAAAW